MERSSIRADLDGDGRLDLTAIYTVPSGRTVENLDQPGTEIDPDPTERIRVETADGSVLDEE